ncbi:MAG: MMPL family transporter, partial [Bdellovibrionales bacterium]|nr:MMPL family transporter [Bdellovibrionales bacterium]
MNKFLHFIVYKPKLSLFMGFLLILAFGFGLNKLHDDFGYRTWFLEEDPNLKAFDRFEQTFGSDEMSIISVYHPDGIFRKETINVIQKLTYDLWRAPEVIRVDSLSNYNWVHSENDDILVEPFFPDEIDITQNLLDKRKQVALTHPSIINYLINKEADTSLIYVNLKPTLGGSPDYKKVVLAFRDIVKKYNGLDNHKVYVAGNPVMNYAFREAAYMDMEHLMPFVVLLTIGLLWFLFRRPSGFVLPILIVGLSTIMTIGLSGWINIPIHSLTSIVPEFMMAIGVAVAIHLLSTFFIFYKEGTSKEEALKITLKKIFFPTILTSVSTSVGFFSFATSSIPTVGELGILTGFGTIFCWLTSYIILVPLIMLTPLKPSKTSPSDINIKDLEPSPKATMYAKWIFKYKYYIIAAFSSLSLLGFYYSLQLNVNSDPLAYFSKSYPLTVATNFVEEKLKSATAVEMIIETHKP